MIENKFFSDNDIKSDIDAVLVSQNIFITPPFQCVTKLFYGLLYM